MLPGGIALSNYSGPNAQRVTINPPYESSDSVAEPACSPLATCEQSASADATTGRLRASASVTTGLGGLVPDIGSNSYAESSVDIVDPFGAGTPDNAEYLFTIAFNDVALSAARGPVPLTPNAGLPIANLELRIQPAQGPSTRRDVSIWGDETGSVDVPVYVTYPFSGPVGISAILSVAAETFAGYSGYTKGSVDLTITCVQRIW
jgi:hypothetical protein